MILIFRLKPLLIFRCLLCLGTGSGVLKELHSEVLDDEQDEPSEELFEEVLILEEADELLSLILCSKEALLLEVSFLSCSSWISPGFP